MLKIRRTLDIRDNGFVTVNLSGLADYGENTQRLEEDLREIFGFILEGYSRLKDIEESIRMLETYDADVYIEIL